MSTGIRHAPLDQLWVQGIPCSASQARGSTAKRRGRCNDTDSSMCRSTHQGTRVGRCITRLPNEGRESQLEDSLERNAFPQSKVSITTLAYTHDAQLQQQAHMQSTGSCSRFVSRLRSQ